MFNLTTPKAVLIGFFMVAISIASLPYSAGMIVRDAQADTVDTFSIELAIGAVASAIYGIDCG